MYDLKTRFFSAMRRRPESASPSERGSPSSSGDLRRIPRGMTRSEEHTPELQALTNFVCRLLLDKKRRSPAGSTARRDLQSLRLAGPAPNAHLAADYADAGRRVNARAARVHVSQRPSMPVAAHP